MKSVRVFAGVDQGTTGTRTNLYDEEGRFLATGYCRTTTRHPAPGWDEQDPEELLDSIEQTLGQALSQVEGAQLTAIGLANQGESVVAFDRGSGKPLSPAILWSDRRSSAIVEEVACTSGQDLLESVTGLPLDPYFSASKIAWMHRNLPEVREASRANKLAVGTLDSFFLFRLSEGSAFVTDPSTGSRTQLMDLEKLHFDPACAAVYDLDLKQLPQIIPTVPLEPIHTTLGAPVTASICDQQAALAAIGGVVPGEIKVTYGTGCFIEANAGPRAVRPGSGLMPTYGWQLGTGASAYAIEGGVFSAGTAVDWFVKLGLSADGPDMDVLAAGSSFGEALFLPSFTGVGAPWWRSGAAGVLAGLRASTNERDLALAVLEGIAQRVTDVLDAIGQEQPLPEEIRVDGGLSASQVLLQLQADLCGRPVVAAAEREGTACGAAGFAAIGAGVLDLPGLAGRARFPRRFEPRMAEPERLERRALWARFVRASEHLDPDKLARAS
jgi:glycerol kinase